MKYIKLKLALVVFLVVGLASTALAVPIVNTGSDGFEDFNNGTVFGYYQNSGDLLFTQEGNNEGVTQYAALQAYMLATYDVTLMVTDYTAFTAYDNNSGTWETVPPLGPDGTINFYVVKAGNYFAMYEVDPVAATGSWSTYDIWAIGGTGTGGNDGLQISHFTGYNPDTTVPEPATMLLLGSGLIGLGVFGRKKVFKKS